MKNFKKKGGKKTKFIAKLVKISYTVNKSTTPDLEHGNMVFINGRREVEDE